MTDIKPGTAENKKNIIIYLTLIVLLGIIVYLNSLPNLFVWDDIALIKRNFLIKDPANLVKIFTQPMGAGFINVPADNNIYAFFRPLQSLSFMIDYSVWGLNPAGYHMTNLVFHILSAICLFWLVLLLVKDSLAAFICSLLFVVHPALTEAVDYVSGRADPMGLCFILLSLIFYILYTETGKNKWLAGILCAYPLALLSKETSLMLIAILGLYHFCVKKRIRPAAACTYLCLTLGYLFFRFIVSGQYRPENSFFGDIPARLPGFFAALANYLRLIFIPANLHMDYGNRIFPVSNPAVITGIIISLVLLALLYRKHKDPVISFSLGWFFLTLMPVSNIFYPLPFYMSEHYLYLPIIGVLIPLSVFLSRLLRNKNARRPVFVGLAAVIVIFASLTMRQNLVWNNGVSLFENSLKYSPKSAKLYFLLGLSYKDKADMAGAKTAFLKSIHLDPGYDLPYNSLAIIYMSEGNFDKSEKTFRALLKINPDYYLAYYNLGLIYTYQKGHEKEAIDNFDKCLELNPHCAMAHYELAKIYYYTAKPEKALFHFRAIDDLGLKIDPKLFKYLEQKISAESSPANN